MKILNSWTLAAALSCFASLCQAGPCVTASLASYAALGPFGCTIGGTVFGSFAALTPTNNAVAIRATDIVVTPVTTGGPALTFQMGASAGAGTILEARFTYQASGANITASAVGLSGTSVTGNGAVSEIQDFCLSGTFDATGVQNCTGSSGEQVIVGPGSNQVTFAPVSMITVSNDLTFDGGPGGTATGGTLTNQFSASSAVCSFVVTPGNQNVLSGQTNQTVSVMTGANCGWQAYSNVSWIIITGGASGLGNGTTVYTVVSNPTASPRSGTLTIAGQTITVTQGAPISSNTQFVTALYQDLLNRAPDTDGLNFYVGELNAGTVTRGQLAAQFFTSNEFSGTGLYLIKLYEAVLRRDPDFAGWSFWFNAVGNGQSTFTVLQSFLTSNEFQSTYHNLSNSDFVTLVYQNVLNRNPDSAGLAYYVGLLNSGALSQAGLMDQFVRSAEYDALIRPRAYANLLYLGFLRRTADSSGLTFWTGVLSNPANLPSAVNSFISSQEYQARF
jgi:hypothetical protein